MMRSRVLLAGATAIASGLLVLTIAVRTSDLPTVTPIASPSPSALVRVPPAEVQAILDGIAPNNGSVIRVDHKVAVQLRDVDRRDSPGIMGATDGTWAIAVAGEFRPSRAVLPTGNVQCRIWFINAAGLQFASHEGGLSRCDPYMSAK